VGVQGAHTHAYTHNTTQHNTTHTHTHVHASWRCSWRCLAPPSLRGVARAMRRGAVECSACSDAATRA
jgi:hypothetical protein